MESIEVVDEQEFLALVEEIKTRMDMVDKQPKEVKLDMYAYGRQGKFGDCKDPEPGMFQVKDKYKWKAWKALAGKDQNECRKKFMELAKVTLVR